MTLALCVALPLAAAMVVGLIGGRLGRRGMVAVVGVAFVLAGGATLAMAQAFALGKTALVAEIAPWLPVRGSRMGLVATMSSIPLLLVAAAAPLALVALSAGRPAGRRFFGGAALVSAGLALVAVAADLLLMAAGWQLAALGTFLLATARDEQAPAGPPAARALALHRVADVAFLVGVASLAALFQTVDIAEIARRMDPSLPREALDRVALSIATPSVLLAAAIAISAVLALRFVLAAWQDAAPTARALAAALAAAPAVLVAIRLGGLAGPPTLAGALVIAAVIAVAPLERTPLAAAVAAASRGLEAGMEGATERAMSGVARSFARASGWSAGMEHGTARVHAAALLALAAGLVAYWSLR